MLKLDSFIEYLHHGKTSQYSKKLSLKYGFRVPLDLKQQRFAKMLNSLYERQVWGTVNDASNQKLKPDERFVIQEWLTKTPYSKNVLEVGSGSGRVTFPLLGNCDSVTALDRESENLRVLQLEARKNKKSKNLKIWHCDFAKKLDTSQLDQKFSSIILIENLLGMNPLEVDRKQIIQNASKLLMKKGLLILGYRVHPFNNPGELFFQAMPYNESYGIAINWSDRRLIKEVENSRSGLKLLDQKTGTSRPAGGKMHFSFFQKE